MQEKLNQVTDLDFFAETEGIENALFAVERRTLDKLQPRALKLVMKVHLVSSADNAAHGTDAVTRVTEGFTTLKLKVGGRAPREGERGERDSLAVLQFVVGIEQEFGIVIHTHELDDANFATTASTTAFVRRKLDEAAT